MTDLSAAILDLVHVYGAPSQEGFGSAVFTEELSPTESLAEGALVKYRFFVGDLWNRYGEDAWMGPWREVHIRPADAEPDIVAELRAIDDADAARSAAMILDIDDGALSAVYDDPEMSELRVFNLGDGGAMSGILVAGRRSATGEAVFLVFLLD